MTEIYLNKTDLKEILVFMESFPDRDIVRINYDEGLGLGSVVSASLVGTTVNGHIVTITKDIVDESSL